MPLHAAVVGGTGLVGRALVGLLARDPAFGRVTLVQRRMTPLADARFEAVVTDLASLRAADLPSGLDAAFCALGTTIRKAGSREAFREVDHDMVLAFARASAERGARSLHVVSAMGADAYSRAFYNRVKGEMERALAEVGVPSVYVYRPSLLVGARDERRALESAGIAAARALAPLLPRGWRAIPATTVARAMAADARRAEPGFHVVPSGEIWTRGGAS